MQKVITLFVMLFLLLPVFGQKPNSTVLDSLKLKDQKLEIKIAELEKQLERNEHFVSLAYESSDHELTAANNAVTILTIILSVLALILGIYITYLSNKVSTMKTDSQNILEQTKTIKAEVQNLDNQIHQNLSGLYKKLRREETITILDRLLSVPEDIDNLNHALLSRDLLPEDFDKIKLAYLKCSTTLLSRIDYLVLTLQHFPLKGLLDKEIRKDIIAKMDRLIPTLFAHEIIKLITDFFEWFKENGVVNYSVEITEIFKGLSLSEHFQKDLIYQTVYNIVQNKSDRFLIYSLIKGDTANIKAVRKHYGDLLYSEYHSAELSDPQKAIIDELNTPLNAIPVQQIPEK